MADAHVYQGESHVATFERTSAGVRLSFVEDAELDHGFLATTLPRQAHETSDLPPFFLNLLPEGARLQLLLESARSRDDSLSLLAKVGWDAIGDVAVLPPDQQPNAHAAAAPQSRLSEANFWDLFYAGISDRPDASIPGVQEKISASTIAFGVRAERVPSAILKLNPSRYPRLVHNEEFFLRMARSCGIEVCKATLVHDRLGEAGLLVTRFDRVKQGKSVRKLHVEDGCQLLNHVPANKYGIPMRDIADSLVQVCTAGVVEVRRLLELYAFCYLIGNGDLHAKNISVLWEDATRLSPAYDLLSTLPYAKLDRHMALNLHGKDDNFRIDDFVQFGLAYGVPARATRHMIVDLCERAAPWANRVDEIGFEPAVAQALSLEIADRIRRLSR